MTRGTTRLEELEALLARAGDDPKRLELVRRAQRFKRSWVDLAEALTALERSGDFQRWGYADLHEYCHKELAIKPATVDKLVVSFSAVQRHAPEILERDGVARQLPTQDAVHYFARAVDECGDDERRRLDAGGDDLVQQLRQAVFDDVRPVGELRRTFDPILRPQSQASQRVETLKRARAAGRRLLQAMQEVEGLSEKRVARVQAAVDALLRDLDAMEPEVEAPQAVPA